MSTTRTSAFRRSADHFEPQEDDDPQAQRRLRGHLEQIDYTVFTANREVLSQALGHADPQKFRRLAESAALARAQWAATALAYSEGARQLTKEQVERLAQLRSAYEELSEIYEGLRRMVERGYLPFQNV